MEEFDCPRCSGFGEVSIQGDFGENDIEFACGLCKGAGGFSSKEECDRALTHEQEILQEWQHRLEKDSK